MMRTSMAPHSQVSSLSITVLPVRRQAGASRPAIAQADSIEHAMLTATAERWSRFVSLPLSCRVDLSRRRQESRPQRTQSARGVLPSELWSAGRPARPYPLTCQGAVNKCEQGQEQ
jgi:hypothetical protein